MLAVVLMTRGGHNLTRRQRVNRHKADLLDRFSNEVGQFDLPADCTSERDIADYEAAQEELAIELYRRAVRLTPKAALTAE